ncbi:TIGR02391 family protein [Streptomyces sp. ACA25]|uniref:TIGR02391 family protein n=1 Tax=Streptomyces sp. ACA25 TaxID=3022596 RepID=UPI0023079936|nr:TIGR02391 family protein [Streptomyces sp. ACA25]MDB1088733.1 TIGR02391 family protein [Streptomyces sp. ACA25]
MDRDWMRQKLEAFDKLADAWLREVQYNDRVLRELRRMEPTVKRILHSLDPGLAEDIYIDHRDALQLTQNDVQRALGIVADMDEWEAHLRPDSPALIADRLHPWVWESAAPMWGAGARQDAVLAAARTINRRLQQKLDRHDISDSDLCLQTFDMKEPAPGKPRLRFPGDRTRPTWRARQDGAKYFAAGAFLALRNVAAHEEVVTWSEQEALEYLASLSVIARWIEEGAVEANT